MSKDAMTLSELGRHLTREAIRASAQMELDQRDLWRDLIRTHSNLQASASMGVPQYLGLDELTYSMNVVPYRQSWFGRTFGFKPKFPPGKTYRFLKKTRDKNTIAITVKVSRKSEALFEPAYTSSPEQSLNPDDTTIVGLPQ